MIAIIIACACIAPLCAYGLIYSIGVVFDERDRKRRLEQWRRENEQ